MTCSSRFSGLGRGAVLALLICCPASVARAQMSGGCVSVYNDASVDDKQTTVYGDSNTVDNCFGCDHGQFSLTIHIGGPSGPIASQTFSGYEASIQVSTSIQGAGTYYVYSLAQFYCSCAGRMVGAAGPAATVDVQPPPVCPQPILFKQLAPGNDYGGGELGFIYVWDSNTGNQADLSVCQIAEHVEYPGPMGVNFHFPPPMPQYDDNGNIVNLVPNPTDPPPGPGSGVSMGDYHTTDGPWHPPYSIGGFSANQWWRWRCTCYQNNAWQTFVGPLIITRKVTWTNPDDSWRFSVTKNNIAPFSGQAAARLLLP